MKKLIILGIIGSLCLIMFSGCPSPSSGESEVVTYSVVYSGNGNTSGSLPSDQNRYEYGESVTIKGNTGNLEKSGYKLIAWNTMIDTNGTTYKSGSKMLMPSSNVTLHAVWLPLDYFTVSFNSNSGTIIQSQYILEGNKIVRPVDPELNGFIFINWYKDTGFMHVWDFQADTVSADTTLYAKWEALPANTYTVSFSTFSNSVINNMVIEEGSTITKPIDPVKDRCLFVNWYSDIELKNIWNFNTDVVSANLTLYAKWNINMFYTEIISIDGGTFTQQNIDNEMTVSPFEHTISSFSISKYAVTYELWYNIYQWALNNNYTFANAGKEGNTGTIGAAPRNRYLPVTNINWRDIIVWCNAYSEKLGRTPVYRTREGAVIKDSLNMQGEIDYYTTVSWNASGFRLPTEGEWKYAASGGNSSMNYLYSGSDNINNVGWYNGNSNNSMHNVGTKSPNELGLYDMSGNVSEFCFDGYGSYPLTAIDYRGVPLESAWRERMILNASYYHAASVCKIGFRLRVGTDYAGIAGFRVASN